MANEVFNVSKGRFIQFVLNVDGNNPAASVLRLFLMQANEAEATLRDRDDIDDIFMQGGNTEATFTNYENVAITDTETSAPTLDDSADTYSFTLTDNVWSLAGNGINNTLTKLIVAYDPDGSDTDTTTIPISHHDFGVTTDGSDLTADFGTTVASAGQ